MISNFKVLTVISWYMYRVWFQSYINEKIVRIVVISILSVHMDEYTLVLLSGTQLLKTTMNDFMTRIRKVGPHRGALFMWHTQSIGLGK